MDFALEGFAFSYLACLLCDTVHLIKKLLCDVRTVGQGDLKEAAHVLSQLDVVQRLEVPSLINDLL